MKATRILLIMITGLFTFFYSCELLDDQVGLTVAERLEGRWRCEENNPFKSAKDAYEVYMYINPIDSNTILISNFLQLESSDAYATITGMMLTLPNQSLEGGFDIYGSGTIASDFKKITWRYFVDDGSGYWSEVNSVYTKLNY
jgi:hypothetical protein